jgi:broad specificity phosphatase PhoE
MNTIPTNSTFVFVRHANTGKATQDILRALTEKGENQARTVGRHLSTVKFDRALSSTAVRTQETGLLILGEDSGLEIKPLDVLYQHPDQEGRTTCNAMFEELGYAPLGEYFRHKDSQVLREFGSLGADAIRHELGESFSGTVLIVSHAVLTNVFIYQLFPCDVVQAAMLDANLGECGTVTIVIGDTMDDITIEVVPEVILE